MLNRKIKRRLGLKSPFAQMTQAQLASLISRPYHRSNAAKVNRTFYNGDHWMDGVGWIGPIPADDDQAYADLKELIRKMFNSRNIIREVVDRRVDGLLKSRPEMKFARVDPITETAPIKPTEQDLIVEASNLFIRWFIEKKILKKLKILYGCSLLDERVVLKIYVPRGLLKKSSSGKTYIPKLSIEEALDIIHVDAVVSDSSGEIIHEPTQMTALVSDIYTERDHYTELVYLEDGDTVIKTITQPVSTSDLSPVNVPQIPILPETSDPINTAVDLGKEWRLSIGGRLTMYEPKIVPMITEQVRENQMAVNLAKTMQNRNTVTAGFLERTIFDAMPPGEWRTDPKDPNNEYYERGPIKVGAGTTNFFMAAEYRNKETGEIKMGSPSIYYRDPVAPATFIDSKRDCYQDILEEVGQPHILISGDATASGSSRAQATQTYRGTLEDDEGEVNPCVTWMMETVMAMAAYFSGEQGKYDILLPQAKCYINTGPLTGIERQDNREDVKANQLSTRTSMSRSGVEDAQAEFERIEEENGLSVDTTGKRVDMMKVLAEWFEPVSAATAVGMTTKQIGNLKLKPKPKIDPKTGIDSNTGLPVPGALPKVVAAPAPAGGKTKSTAKVSTHPTQVKKP